MKILLVYAHPEPRSLNGALKDFAVQHLQNAGHEVQVSDLYAMRWKAGFDAAVGRYGDFSVPAMVVFTARHHEGLD